MEVKDQLTDEDFIKKNPEERDLILFKKLEEVSGLVASLCGSKWKMAVPAVKWVVFGVIAIAAMYYGYIDELVKLITIVG
jgi:hypothetical protein